MKNNKQTVAHSTLGVGSYRSPEVTVSEIFNEGVLCGSTRVNSHETWDEVDLWS